jgi:hypothetical protein
MKNAPSTVALSAYNVLAKAGEPIPAQSLFNIVARGLQDPGITGEMFARCLAELQTRGLIRVADQSKGLLDVLDPRRRLVRWRDRTGDGWNNWMVDSERGPVPLYGAQS